MEMRTLAQKLGVPILGLEVPESAVSFGAQAMATMEATIGKPFDLRVLPRDMNDCRWNSTQDHPLCRALARKVKRATGTAPAMIYLRIKSETLQVRMPSGKRLYYRLDKTAVAFVNDNWNLPAGRTIGTTEVKLIEAQY